MSNRGGGRSDGKGGSSGNAPPPAPAQSDANKQSEPAAATPAATPVSFEGGANFSGEVAFGSAGTDLGNAPPPAQSDNPPTKVEAPAAAPPKPPAPTNAARTARLKAADYTRPSIEEFVKAGYETADYETYFDKHEAGLEAELDERASVAKLAPPQPGWIRCRALKTSLVRGMVKGPGEEFWLSEEEALRAIDKGSAEPI